MPRKINPLDVADEVARNLQRQASPEPEPTVPASAEPAEPATAEAGAEPTTPPSVWRKLTVPYRSAQLAALNEVLARLLIEKHVTAGAAETIRLAVDQLLRRYEDDPDGVLLELYHQQQAELRLTEKRKHAPSRGLAEYLRRRGLL